MLVKENHKEYGQEFAEIWQSFIIEDPYQLCFGFLYLVDNGSDLPWLYFPGVHLMGHYEARLPWTRNEFNGAEKQPQNQLVADPKEETAFGNLYNLKYPDFFENVVIDTKNDMHEIIDILENKAQNERPGVTLDAYRRTIRELKNRANQL